MTPPPAPPTRRRVLLLGSTGSIGTSALKVARAIPERMEIVGLAASRSVDALVEQARETGARHVALTDPAAAAQARALLPAGVEVFSGEAGLVDLVRASDADLVLVAIVGVAGLAPALAAIETGKHLAVASKEILVMAGEAVMDAARRQGVHVLPVDSEHNAIFQCLPPGFDRDLDAAGVARLILTASGGPFRDWPAADLAAVTPEQACAHPNWAMGRKISVDSATLMNKGLEVIEAHWLFGAPGDRIEVLVHPQSLVHSLVEYRDGSLLAQLGSPDMRTVLAHGLAWPERIAAGVEPLDLVRAGRLEFQAPDRQRFPCLDLAYQALRAGGPAPCALNAANEVAVAAFLERRLPFTGIAAVVEQALAADRPGRIQDLDSILAYDAAVRRTASAAVGRLGAAA